MKNVFWKILIRLKWFLHPADRKRGMGDSVPDFLLRDLSGTAYILSSYYRKKSVILWMTNLCETCQERIGFLSRVCNEFGPRVEVLAISILGNDRATPESILRKYGVKFPLLLDPGDWVGKVLGFEHPPGACPMHNLLILDISGRIILKHHLSAITDQKLLDVLGSSRTSPIPSPLAGEG
ncbi:MAG: redoxin domain-containing protein [Elusimicrobia bacterium]|nr:redoxin domain-containing protein [Elusimicrobiota bacterium]